MKENDVLQLTKWLIEKAVYLLVLFFVLVGLLFSVAMNQARELRSATPAPATPILISITIHACSFALMASAMAWAIEVLHWNTWLMCFMGGFMGMGANTISNWLLTLWTSSENPVDLFTEITRWFRAFWSAYNATKNNNQPPTPPAP